jgi:hypothetical protein
LGVAIDEKSLYASAGESGAQVNAGRGLPNATFLVGDSDNSRHLASPFRTAVKIPEASSPSQVKKRIVVSRETMGRSRVPLRPGRFSDGQGFR